MQKIVVDDEIAPAAPPKPEAEQEQSDSTEYKWISGEPCSPSEEDLKAHLGKEAHAKDAKDAQGAQVLETDAHVLAAEKLMKFERPWLAPHVIHGANQERVATAKADAEREITAIPLAEAMSAEGLSVSRGPVVLAHLDADKAKVTITRLKSSATDDAA
jgi:hypothetical protein